MPLNPHGPVRPLNNIHEFDNPHTTLLEHLDALREAIGTTSRQDELGGMARGIVADMEAHFQDEESLMRQHGFPGSANHHIEHVTLTKKAKQLRRHIRAGELSAALETHDILAKWLKHHILSADGELEVFLNGHAGATTAENN
jgi:hemerythrin